MKKFLFIIIILIGISYNCNASSVTFKYYGTDLNVEANEKGFPKLAYFDEASIKNAILEIEKNQVFETTIKNCLALKEKLNLNDWGYFVMIDEMAKAYTNQFSHPTNISPLIMAFICSKTGYNVKIGLLSDQQINMFYRTDTFLENVPYTIFDGKLFFCYEKKREDKMKISNIILIPVGTGEKSLDFTLLTPPLLNKNMVEGKPHKASKTPEWNFTIRVNKNLIDFYNDYPLYRKKDDHMTKSINCAVVPFSEEVKEQLYPQLKRLMSGHDQLENVNSLLSWIQYGFEYKLDANTWGFDRPFYPEETLYYQYSDAEDRANLFARLVNDLLGLKTAYLYSVKISHAAIGVHFTDKEVDGDYVICNGEKYIICDPTYYGAPAGKKLARWEPQKISLFNFDTKTLISQNSTTQHEIATQLSAEECYNKGKSFNDQKDYTNAMEWYLKAANQGHAQAQVMIGWYYKNGYAVEANTDKALDWYLKAAKQGYAQAQYLAGAVYNDRKDYTNAAKWYQKAADQDHASAQINLGALYNNGQGVAQDFKKAVEWYQKSAYQGNVYAQNNLGWMYEKGRGVPQDFVKAAEWYERAANKDFALAKKNLARIQEFLPKDNQKQQVLSEQNKSIAQNNVSKVQTQAKKTEEPAITSSNTPRQQTAITTIVMPDVDKDIPLTTVKNPNLLAVIIGNENYRKLPDVPYAENDARMFKEYCEKTLGVTEEHIKYLPNAGLVDIYDARDWLKTGAESYGNDASVIFYYAGHGLPNRETGLPYILPVEVDGSNLKLAVSLQELYDEFGKLPARSVTVFLDACFTGVDRDNNVVASREGERLAFKMSPKIPTPTGKTIVFSATENNQTAHPFKDRNHGFFTYFLLRKLQESKGEATLGEIADFVSNGVRRAVFDKIQTSQTPSVKPSGNFANDWRQMKLK